jgi:hypothetical protein
MVSILSVILKVPETQHPRIWDAAGVLGFGHFKDDDDAG